MHWAVRLKNYRGKLLPLLFFIILSVAATRADAQQVTISGANLSFEKVLKEIRNQTGFNFVCKDEWAKDIGLITLDAKNVSVDEILRMSLNGKPFAFTVHNKVITIFPASLRITVTGKVVDNTGKPMQGVSVTVKGTQAGTSTNQDGDFSIRDVNVKSMLVFSYIGFQTIQENVSRGNIYIRMIPENRILEDAVVNNGYQKIKQKFLTGSVTSLRMDSIMQPGINTVDKMLEGRVPGLTYMQNSGQSGAAPKLRIRGTSTVLGSREPLWVVDGIIRTNPIPIPADRLNDPDFVNLLGNAISGINPHDIEQIDVLKDATAAALYGVRAANGVIVITTKRGQPGPPSINYNVTGTFTRRPRYTDRAINMMNSRERIDVSREMIEKKMPLRGGALEAYERAILEYYGGQIDHNTFSSIVDRAESMNTDWMGNTMQDAFATNHSLSISGGSTSAKYFVSVGYNSEPGVIRKEANDRYSALANLTLSYRKFKVDINLSLNKGRRRYTPAEVGVLNYAYGTSRAIPLYNEDGSLYYYATIGSTTGGSPFYDLRTMNILNEMDRTGQVVENSEYVASTVINYEIAKGLQLNSRIAYTGGTADLQTWFEENTEWVKQLKYNSWNPSQGVFMAANNPLPFGGELRMNTNQRQNYTLNSTLQFNRFLDKRQLHNLSAAAGIELNSARTNSYDRINRGYYPDRGHSFAQIDPTKYPGYNTWLLQNASGTITQNLQNSMRTFLTASWIINSKYVLNASTAQEYSNAFGARSNEKFLPTWSLSGRWNMYDDVFRNVSWVDDVAMRASFGIQGNMPPDQSPYAIFTKGSIDPFYQTNASNIVSFPNPRLSWEKKYDYSAGAEFSLLKGKIRGSVEYFYTKTTNAFLPKNVSSFNGIPRYTVNGGTLENRGVELVMHFRVIDNMGSGNKKGFVWRVDPQLSQVFNSLTQNNLNSRNVLADAATINYRNYLTGTVPVDGKSINTFYSYRFKTLDHNYGYPIFYGAEPDQAGTLSAEYRKMTKEQVLSMVLVESGRRDPVVQAGINNAFLYKNWSLNINFTYSIGNKVRLLQIASGNYGTFRPSSQQNLRKEFVNRWRSPGDENYTDIPGIQGQNNINESGQTPWWRMPGLSIPLVQFAEDYYQMYDNSDIRVVKGDYLKLQYASLGYRLPESICKRWNMKGATVQLSGNNLFSIADKALRGQDPSQSGSAPNINVSVRPVYALNINLSF